MQMRRNILKISFKGPFSWHESNENKKNSYELEM